MQCRGPSTALNARKRLIGTNSKPKAATAWNCWLTRPNHQFVLEPARARAQSRARSVFGQHESHILDKVRHNPQSASPAYEGGQRVFDAFSIALIWY